MIRAFMFLSIVISVCTIILGKAYWDQKISAQVDYAAEEGQVSVPDKQKDSSEENISSYGKNLPADAQQKLIEASNSKKPVKMVIFGSDTTSGSAENWAVKLEKELESVYSKNVLDVYIELLPDVTTKDVMKNKLYEKIKKQNPDFLLIEPFFLNDNGVVGIENSLENLNSMLNEIKSGNEDMTIFVQPSYPLYNATFYPKEIERLEEYSAENNLVYLNHWKDWPDHKSEKLLEFLEKGKEGPSKKGHQIWYQYLRNYFISID